MDKESQIIKQQVVYEGKWIKVLKKDFSIGEKVIKDYECVERNKSDKVFQEFDGVSMAPILYNTPTGIKQIIIIAQFRPPAGKFMLEFPAGLVESDDLFENAERELREETGYHMDKQSQIEELSFPSIPISVDDPGLCSGSGKFIIVKVDYKDIRNQKVTQELDEAENIRVHLINLDSQLLASLIQLAQSNGYWISTKLYTFAAGFCFSQVASKF
ncbi:hypothetical protein ABPG74_016187 [Tetrahymena malaccensis]